MNVFTRHKAAALEQIAGAKMLATALRKRIRYIKLIFVHFGQLPRLFAVHQQAIQNLDESIGTVGGLANDLQGRLRHHERGPLAASTRQLARQRQRLQHAAQMAAFAKTAEERQAAEREMAQVATELEAESMPDSDVTIDGQTGQTLERSAIRGPGDPKILRLHD